MRRLLAVAVAALLFPMAASAEVSLGAKLGLGVPMGDAAKDEPMKDYVAVTVPLELSANFALAPNVEVGVYGGFAFAKQNADIVDACDAANADCSEHLWRLGVKGEYLLGTEGIIPFVGANFGWEWDVTKFKESSTDTDFTETLSGWEFGVEAGADTQLSEQLKVGAFIGLSFGKYGKYKDKGTFLGFDADDSGDIPSDQQAVHEWLTIGVRGTFGL